MFSIILTNQLIGQTTKKSLEGQDHGLYIREERHADRSTAAEVDMTRLMFSITWKSSQAKRLGQEAFQHLGHINLTECKEA